MSLFLCSFVCLDEFAASTVTLTVTNSVLALLHFQIPFISKSTTRPFYATAMNASIIDEAELHFLNRVIKSSAADIF